MARYDWTPFFSAINGAIDDYSERQQYAGLLGGGTNGANQATSGLLSGVDPGQLAMLRRLPPKVGMKLLGDLIKPDEYGTTPQYNKDGSAFVVSKNGKVRTLEGISARDPNKIAPNGQVYNEYEIAPGQVFNDPNKAFGIGANGETVGNTQFQNFELARQNARRPVTTITNDMRQESAYSTARGGQFAEMAKAVDESAANASAGLNNMAIIDAALSAPGVYQGANQESINTLRKFGSTVLGMDLKGIPETDVARSVGNQLALDLKKDTKDPSMSSSELSFYQMIPPGLSNVPGGNKVLIDIRTRKYQRDLGVAKLAREYEAKHGQLDAGFVEQRAQFLEKNRINTPDMVQRIRQLAGSAQQQQPRPGMGQQGPASSRGNVIRYDAQGNPI